MKSPKDNKRLMQAVNNYLLANNFLLPDNADFQYCIDGVLVFIDDKIVLSIGDRPDLPNYPINETEHTDKYLRLRMAVAV